MSINKGIVLYGAGAKGNIIFLNATNMNIPVKAFVDQRADIIKLFRGIDVIRPEVAYNKLRQYDWIIAIGDKAENNAIQKNLINKNIVSYKSLEEYCVGELDYNTLIVKYGDNDFCFPVAEKYLAKNSLIYSFGVGDNWSFEMELYNKLGGNVYMFDPSPNVVYRMKKTTLPKDIFFENIGLSNSDELKRFHTPNKNYGEDYSELNCPWTTDEVVELQTHRLSTIMKAKGHTHIHLLKMDIEGSEFAALPDILESDIKIDQICIETHARIFPNSVKVMRNLKEILNDNGYLLVCNTMYEQTYLNKNIVS